MSENNAPLKLKLKSTDTNKFRVVNEEPKAPAPNEKAPDAGASATQQVVDPISLRDTATGRLRKISENQDAMAAAPITMDTPPNKTQTVRLKVVRQDSKAAGPQTLRPTLGTTGAQKLSLRKDEGTPVLNPDENSGAPKLQLKKSDDEKAPAASATQNVQPPIEPAAPALKLSKPAEAPAPTATQSVQAPPPPVAPLKINVAKPAEAAAPAVTPVTVKTVGAPAAAPSPAATQSVSAPSAPAAAPASSPSATVKLALPKMPKKPGEVKPATPVSAAAAPAATAAPVTPTVAVPKANVPTAAPAAAPAAPKVVPSLKKPAAPAGTPAVTPTLKKPEASAPVATPVPAQNDVDGAEQEDTEVTPAGISKWVSISAIIACAALIGTIVYQVLIALKMLR